MKSTLLRRFFALTTAMVFLLFGAGDAFGAHACPQHDLVGLDGEHSAERGPASSEASHDHGETPAAPDADHGPCTCQGGCPTLTAGTLPADVVRTVHVAPVPAAAVSIGATQALLPRFGAYVLPYAHAPPLIG